MLINAQIPTVVDADLLILGGGCAGLSLGHRCAELPTVGKTVILEARNHYINDRTWCFWRVKPHRFQHLVTQSWSKMAVTSQARDVLFNCDLTPYEMIPAERFYVDTQTKIAKSLSVELKLGIKVLAPPRFRNNLWHVETSAGPIVARQIVDTRPSRTENSGALGLWQSFTGDEIECDTPCFDPTTAGLMHFDNTKTGEILFKYILPFSKHRALVETTIFGPRQLDPTELAAIQAANIDSLCGYAPIRVHRTESGILPMKVVIPPAATKGYASVGLKNGAARPSTGYAFQRIQNWADACAASLANGGPVISHFAEPLLRREMDRLFLRVLRTNPERGPEIFTRLFGNGKADRVIRFLSDTETLADCVALGFRLPIGLFLRALLASLADAPEAIIPKKISSNAKRHIV